MAFDLDPTIVVNLILCIIIVILGILCWKKAGEPLPLYIGVAFGLFGISHAATLAGLKTALEIPMIVVRAIAYLVVVFALFQHLHSSMMAKETRQAWVDYYKDDGNKKEGP